MNILEFYKYLESKKIAIIGLGVSNIPLLKKLLEKKLNITVFDKREYNDLNDEVKGIIENNNLKTSLGENYLEKLTNFDIIFRSPSMLPTNEYLEKEKSRGAIITTEIEQVIKLAPCQIIGITGSKGKTTTTTITYELLKGMGYNTYLGGNIGTPLFDKLEEMKNKDIIVLELSSFQLMNMPVSPSIAVVTNITPDHLDIHGSYEEYINAKKHIFLNQDENGLLILNDLDDIVRKFNADAKGEVKYFSDKYIKDSYIVEDNFITYNHEKIIDTNKLILKGKHNHLNIACSLNAIAKYINVDNKEIEKIASKINSPHHRLEYVRTINGVDWYNDSASTTPDKALAGINAFDEKIVLIAGGYDKNIPYTPLAKPILNKVSKLILFGNTKNKIYDAVMEEKKKNGGDTQIYVLDTLEEVIDIAHKVSEKGEVVLFSPASASFDMFKNAYQRGDIFKEIVNSIESI